MQTTDMLDILSLAAAHLVDVGWTTHFMARTEDGSPCGFNDDRAASYCLLGALESAQHCLHGNPWPGGQLYETVVPALIRATGEEFRGNTSVLQLIEWNNTHANRDMVLEAFSRTAHALSSK